MFRYNHVLGHLRGREELQMRPAERFFNAKSPVKVSLQTNLLPLLH
jgi:hypothetical protein